MSFEFQRKSVTLPAVAGDLVYVDIKGHGVIIESVNLYSSIEEVPLMYFDDSGNREQPLYPQSKYLSNERFKRLVFKATPESVGDIISILVTDACIEPDINISLNLTGNKSTYKKQFKKSIAGSSVITISSLELMNSEGLLPTAVYLYAAKNNIQYAYDVTPTAALNFPLRTDAENPTKINSLTLIKNMKFKNSDTGGTADSELNILCEY